LTVIGFIDEEELSALSGRRKRAARHKGALYFAGACPQQKLEAIQHYCLITKIDCLCGRSDTLQVPAADLDGVTIAPK
jgi:hypothetical protein